MSQQNPGQQQQQQAPAPSVQQVLQQLDAMQRALQQSETTQAQLAAALQASQAQQAEMQRMVQELQSSAGLTASPSASVPAFKGTDLLKQAVQPPKALAEKAHQDWERFVFQVETYLALMDATFPKHLDEARRSLTPLEVDEDTQTMDYRILSVKLFAMLTSWVQDAPSAVKIARSIQSQNGFELWRLLWREYQPEQANKALVWRRALLAPRFPKTEAEFSSALQEWENDMARYTVERGPDKAISDEDKRALLITESPAALRQHLAMHAARLTTYEQVREVVVSYLQAKRVWIPTASYASHASRRHDKDPDAMDIGKVDDRKGKGSGKGKDKKGGGKGNTQGQKGSDKGSGKDKEKGKPPKKEKDKCPICWRTGHAVQDCWFNSKGAGKGKQQQGQKGAKGGVHAVADETASTALSAGPSVSVAAQHPSSSATSYRTNVMHVADQRHHICSLGSGCSCTKSKGLLVDTGACVSVCRPGTFEAPVDSADTLSLYTVDDTPLACLGATEPLLTLGGNRRQKASTKFQVVNKITDDILSVNRAVDAGASVVFGPYCYIQWADGTRADFYRRGNQYVLPYEEVLHPRRAGRPAKVAAVGVADPDEEAVDEFARMEAEAEAAGHPDPEAAAAEAFAQREAQAQHAAERAAEDQPDLESQAIEQEPQASSLSEPKNPTPEEKAQHELTHLPFAPWCECCVNGAGKDGHHRRKTDFTGTDEAVIQMDYTFFERNSQQSRVENESSLVTVLTLVDTSCGWPLSIQVPRKGAEQGPYVLNTVEQYLNTLGHKRIILQTDQENSIRTVANAIRNRMGAHKVKLRESPPYSHQSQGAVEGEHAKVAGLMRSILFDLQQKYPANNLDINHVVFPWLVRHAAWLTARYQMRTRDKATPYRIINGVDYQSAICRFGETIMAKLPQPGTKTQTRWVKAIWCGKLERDNTHIILTEAGVLSVRSVRRLPQESQQQASIMSNVTGLPWQPRWGRRVQVTPQTSTAIAVPLPPIPPAELVEDARIPAPSPLVAEDGPANRVDEETLEVDGAALARHVEDDDMYTPSLPGEEVPETPAAAPTSPHRGAGWSSHMQSLPSTPPMPSGLGEGGMSPKRSPEPGAEASERPPKQVRAEPPKKARMSNINKMEDIWLKIEQWANSEEPTNPFAQQRLASVCEWLDGVLDPAEVGKAREAQLRKLWGRGAFHPVHRSDVPKGSQVFHHKWVDKAKEGVYKSRFTCAAVKRAYSEEVEQDLRVFVPTPTPEAHALLEVNALAKNHSMRTFDIVAAFLIGRDRGAQSGDYVYVRAPPEWWPIFQEWVKAQPVGMQAKMLQDFSRYVFRLDGNLYGRRTAGSVYRDELEQILCDRLAPEFQFKRGVKHPCVYRCEKSQVVLVHHIDDVRCAGPTATLNRLIDELIPKFCEIQSGPLEAEGVAVEVLGRTKTRLKGAVLTAPDPRHTSNILQALGIGEKEKSPVPSRKQDLAPEKSEPLDAELASRYRSAVGSAIYLSSDRKDIAYSVKELARKMAQPRVCDWECAQVLGRYLNSHREWVRVVTLDAEVGDELPLDIYSDSDWAGCAETRRSTDSHVAYLAGAVVAVTTQTQPGLPATSSPDAELRGISRAAREAIFLKDLAVMDFGMQVAVPRLWSDSSTGILASKRIGPGSKLRHLDVADFYVQGAIQSGRLQMRKVKGTANPANFLTKHAKSGVEVVSAMPSLGMVDVRNVAGASTAQKGTVKTIQVNPTSGWKGMRSSTTHLQLIGTLTMAQILGARAQTSEADFGNFVFGMFLIGLLATCFMALRLICVLTRWGRRFIRHRTLRPQTEDEPEPAELEAEEQENNLQQPERAAPPERDAPPEPGEPRRRPIRERSPPYRTGCEMYFAQRGETAHIYRNCAALRNVPLERIRTEDTCGPCQLRVRSFLETGGILKSSSSPLVHFFGDCTGIPNRSSRIIVWCSHCLAIRRRIEREAPPSFRG